MTGIEIFTMTLGLQEPWHVTKAEFRDAGKNSKELHLWIGFTPDYKFSIGGSKPSTAYAMLLIEEEMPVNGVSLIVKETAPRIWRIFNHWETKAVDKIDLSMVKRIGVDETSKRKGHDYITQFVDLDKRRTIFVTEGRDKETFDDFKKVGIIFDKFHIYKALNEAIDKVRKLEHENAALLKGHKYTFLYDKSKLSEKRKMELETLLLTCSNIGKAYGFKESFKDIYEDMFNNPNPAKRLEEEWCPLVEASGIKPMQDFVKMIRSHMFGIRTFFTNRAVNNGILEGLNSKIQLAKKRARGFCNIENFKNVIYYACGKLQMDYTHYPL